MRTEPRRTTAERNAAKRLLSDLRREHAHIKAVIVEDGPASNGPRIRHLRDKGFRFILGAKPGDHELLFSRVKASETQQTWETRDKTTGRMRRFEWDSHLPLNDANFEVRVNMLNDEETDTKGTQGKRKSFSWITDLPPELDMVMSVMRAARRRWTIENETFQTPKARDGYNFEHNFGHGNNHPADVFATLAMRAFLIDQVQRHCCPLFGKAREHQERILSLWDRMRSLLQNLRITDWQTFHLAMSAEMKKPELAALLPDGP